MTPSWRHDIEELTPMLDRDDSGVDPFAPFLPLGLKLRCGGVSAGVARWAAALGWHPGPGGPMRSGLAAVGGAARSPPSARPSRMEEELS